MKRLLLIIAVTLAAPAHAQQVEVDEEERQIEIRMESDVGGVEVGAASGSAAVSIAAFPDKSVWHIFGNGNITHCWVDEDNEPHCKEVKPE